jgi:hypothetical protein
MEKDGLVFVESGIVQLLQWTGMQSMWGADASRAGDTVAQHPIDGERQRESAVTNHLRCTRGK